MRNPLRFSVHMYLHWPAVNAEEGPEVIHSTKHSDTGAYKAVSVARASSKSPAYQPPVVISFSK